MRHAFSLLELAVVLVILGLITGGVLTGKSLIEAGQTRSVISEYSRIDTAGRAFTDKYQALPGDWNEGSTNFGGPAANDGDSDGMIENAAAANGTGEVYQFWRQLSLEGLIEGSYTGVAGPGAALDSRPGTNVMASRFPNAGWAVVYLYDIGPSPDINGDYEGDATHFAAERGNMLTFGAPCIGCGVDMPSLTPTEASNIDSKLDDGTPSNGRIYAAWRANTCANSTSATDKSATYRLENNTKACGLYWLKQF
jgi:prepilin-type N-terminal cleavage/methylation domain-containing protein